MEAQRNARYWDTVSQTPYLRSKEHTRAINEKVNEALDSHALEESTEEAKRFNELSEQMPSLKGEERAKALAEMADIARAYAEANGYEATICESSEEYMQTPGVENEATEEAKKNGALFMGHYYQGHVYINIEDMTQVKNIATHDLFTSTLVHESTHNDNATDKDGTMAHVVELLENGDLDMEEALDIIEAVSESEDYRNQVKTLQAEGKNVSDLVADELMAHMLQAMSWGVPAESMTKNKLLTNLINEANERREEIRSSRADVSQRSENVDDVSRGQVQPSGTTATNDRTGEPRRSIRNDGEEQVRNSLRDNESADKVYADKASVPTQEELGEGLAEEVKDYVPQAVPWQGGALYDGQKAVVVSKNNESNTIGVAPGVGHPRWSAQTMLNSDAN